jgi:hypothetical protein
LEQFEKHKVCGATEIISFMKKEFDWIPADSSSWVSRFCNKNGLRSHRTQKRPAKRNRDEYESEVINYRQKLEEERSKRKRGKVWHMDEAGLYNDATRERSYSPNGTTPQISTPNDHGRDTIIATVCENGEKLPLFYIHHKKKVISTRANQITGEKYRVVIDKGISGLNNEIMDKWVTKFLTEPQVNLKDDILALDNHRSHLNKKIMKRLLDSGLSVMPFPKGAAAELSMLDNSLFRDFKRDMAKEWEKEEFALDRKEEVALCVWNDFPVERIKSYWRKNGYLERPRRRRPTVEKTQKKKVESRTIHGTAPISSYFRKQ